jgi:hypothetical protein
MLDFAADHEVLAAPAHSQKKDRVFCALFALRKLSYFRSLSHPSASENRILGSALISVRHRHEKARGALHSRFLARFLARFLGVNESDDGPGPQTFEKRRFAIGLN